MQSDNIHQQLKAVLLCMIEQRYEVAYDEVIKLPAPRAATALTRSPVTGPLDLRIPFNLQTMIPESLTEPLQTLLRPFGSSVHEDAHCAVLVDKSQLVPLARGTHCGAFGSRVLKLSGPAGPLPHFGCS